MDRFYKYVSVKAFVTAVFTIVTALLFYEGRDIPGELMVINTVVIIDYFRSKDQQQTVAAMSGIAGHSAQPASQEPLAAPYIPDPQAPR